MGAGCSVTSDIKTGNQLVEKWRKEIFSDLYSDREYSKEESIELLQKEHGQWYDPKNEYSSLFERRYDLKSQRRAFVESEVANKNPSIGYAYLIKLVQKNFFNVIFTPNFDDLLNESFYTFSGIRPIYCAHDSAIQSISTTSTRPKIIKLHGDYLFDDIKSTIRETESLEENIKQKFYDFSKNSGLIVVGYSGYDRSIMDVLFHLIKREEYYKNGVYWCIRKGTVIEDELRKLLWKDRVYYVEIDGFDELFCELNFHLNKNELPISTSIISDSNEEKLNYLLNNGCLEDTKSDILKIELKRLRLKKDQESLNEVMKYIGSIDEKNDKKKNKTSIGDRIFLLKQYEEYSNKNFDAVVEAIEKKINIENLDDEFLFRLLALLAKGYDRIGENPKSKKVYRRMLGIDPFSIRTYHNYLKQEPNYISKLKIIDEAIANNRFASELYYLKAKIVYDLYEEKFEPLIYDCQKFNEILKEGIRYDKSINNPCWKLYFDLNYSLGKDESKFRDNCKEIIKNYIEQNPSHYEVISRNVDLMIHESKEIDEIEDYINNEKTKDTDFDIEFAIILLLATDELKSLEKIESLLKRFKKHDQDERFVRIKSRILVDRFNRLDEAIELLESIVEPENLETITLLIDYYLYKKEIAKAKDLFKEKNVQDERTLKKIYECDNDWHSALNSINKLISNKGSYQSTVIPKSHILLNLNEFEDAKDLLRPFLDNVNWDDDIMVLNYEIACYESSGKYNKERVDKFIKKTNNKTTEAAYLLLSKKKEAAISKLKETIKDDYSRYYYIQDCYVFNKYLEPDEISGLI
ncbi:MAG: hypothetical protein GY870_18785 [archaeon]|nr:hypothetical protein [archaeon]